MTKINTAYVSTIVLDYCWIASFLLVFYGIAADTSSYSPMKKALCNGLTTLYLPFLNTAREQLYWILHKGSFSEFKTKWRMADHMSFVSDVIISTSCVTFGIALMSYHGMLETHLFDVEGGLLQTMFIVSRDFWIINLLKDNTCMRYIHPWMHKRENYWLHKQHHKGRKDLNYIHAFVFDLFDLVIEFLIGGVLALAFNKVVFGKASVHLVSLMYCLWCDGNVHSENPYSQCVGNPILDYYLKLNICHNLHHAAETDSKYMTVMPYHHVSSTAREFDVARYNKIMKTNVDYRFLLD